MAVSDGQKANATNFNNAFVSRTQDTNTVGKVDLNNPNAESGTQISNVQKELNSQASFSGTPVNLAQNNKPTWNSDSIGAPNDDVKTRVDNVQSQVETNITSISDNASDIADIRTTTGTSDGDTNMGSYVAGSNGFNLTANENTKANIQGLIDGVDARVLLTEKGAANGVATLDAGGRMPAAQLPTSATEYKGAWDANTNTPTLADGVGTNGDLYRISVAGTQDLGSGSVTYGVGDAVIYNGTIWQRIPADNVVASVNGQTGVVVLDTDDIAEGATNLYYTEARVTANASVTANTAKVSADGSVDTHSDVDVTTTPPVLNDVLQYDGSNFVPAALSVTGADNASMLENLGLNAGVAASALTVGIRQSDGSTAPTGGSPVTISFRNATPGLGSYTKINVTSSIDITIPSGATMGHRDATDDYIYVYALNNSGTVEVAVTSQYRDEGSIVSTTAISAAADDNDIYSTVARSSVPIRLIGRIRSNQTTAGTWNAAVGELSVATLSLIKPAPEYIEVDITSRPVTAVSNTHVQSTESMVLSVGKWKVGFSVALRIDENAGVTNSISAAVALYDGTNTLADSGAIFSESVSANNSIQYQALGETEIELSAVTTFNMDIVCTDSVAQGSARIEDLSGASGNGLNGGADTNASKMWARRVV